MPHNDLQHGVFADFRIKHFVGEAGLNNEKRNRHEIFPETNF